MHYVYILLSKSTNKTYVGCSNNVEKRLKQHNTGLVKSTKFGSPWNIIYVEDCKEYIFARKREKYFKSRIGRIKIRNILNNCVKKFYEGPSCITSRGPVELRTTGRGGRVA